LANYLIIRLISFNLNVVCLHCIQHWTLLYRC